MFQGISKEMFADLQSVSAEESWIKEADEKDYVETDPSEGKDHHQSYEHQHQLKHQLNNHLALWFNEKKRESC